LGILIKLEANFYFLNQKKFNSLKIIKII